MFFTQNAHALSLEEIRKKAPAVFAEAPKSTTSDRYLFIPTLKILSGLMANGWSVVSAVQTRSRSVENKEFNRHTLMLARTEDLLRIRDADVNAFIPLLRQDNSHNALSSFSLSAGLYRKVCANGLTVPDTMLAAPTVRHSKSITDEAIEASFRVVKDFPKLTEQVMKMQSVNLSDDERKAFAVSAQTLAFDSDKIDFTNNLGRNRDVATQLLNPNRYQDRKTDLWTTLNVVQENIIRGGVRLANPESEQVKLRKTRAVSNLNKDKMINQALMTLACEMAKIKGTQIVA